MSISEEKKLIKVLSQLISLLKTYKSDKWVSILEKDLIAYKEILSGMSDNKAEKEDILFHLKGLFGGMGSLIDAPLVIDNSLNEPKVHNRFQQLTDQLYELIVDLRQKISRKENGEKSDRHIF